MLIDPMYLDIETVPLAAALEAPYPADERPCPSNYKDPVKIADWHAKDRDKWAAERAKECSLNPRLGRVLCIGMSHDLVVTAKTEADEASVLRSFWGEMEAARGEVVSWNGQWDLRFLVIRSMVHGIKPTVTSNVVRAWFARYKTYPHFDCRAVLTNWEPYKAGEGLAEWSEFFGVDGKAKGMSGADVYPLYQVEHFEEIEQYCRQDVAAVREIYRKISPMFASMEARVA